MFLFFINQQMFYIKIRGVQLSLLQELPNSLILNKGIPVICLNVNLFENILIKTVKIIIYVSL